MAKNKSVTLNTAKLQTIAYLPQFTLRFLLYVLVVFFLIESIIIMYWTVSKKSIVLFFYYYTTLPIIPTGMKFSLHLQIFVLVDLKSMNENIYKTSTYNKNLRVTGYSYQLF